MSNTLRDSCVIVDFHRRKTHPGRYGMSKGVLQEQDKILISYVTKNLGPSLLGREWIADLN